MNRLDNVINCVICKALRSDDGNMLYFYGNEGCCLICWNQLTTKQQETIRDMKNASYEKQIGEICETCWNDDIELIRDSLGISDFIRCYNCGEYIYLYDNYWDINNKEESFCEDCVDDILNDFVEKFIERGK